MMVEENDLSMIMGMEGCDGFYCVSEFTAYLQASLSSKDCKSGFVFWTPETYQQSEYELFDESNNSSNSSFHEGGIKEKIKCALEEMTSLQFRKPYLVQFWAPKVDGRGRYLTTSDQPFALGWNGCMTLTGGHFHKGLCWYRKHSANHLYLVKEGAQEEELGSIRRVYRNMHPESSPDLRLYSTKEFPLRDHAARCGLRTYLALPVFDLRKEKCYGVLEFLSIDHLDPENELTRGDYVNLEEGLKAANLRSTHIDFSRCSESEQAMANGDITEMLELAIKAVPQLHMAQVWVPCKQCANTSTNLSCMERATFITTEDMHDQDMHEYLAACEFHKLQIGKGITRTLMSSNNKCCFCRNICDYSISENPLAHYAQKARLSFCFAICIESVHNCNDLYVVEFFLQPNSREDACGGSLVHLLLRIMETKLKNFKFASGGTTWGGISS
ncbi:hypothetical protein Pfo_010235 [Paulownia fortunei]|nr:hypothetical protein Pfo_010235 [Paulownia fortunei]